MKALLTAPGTATGTARNRTASANGNQGGSLKGTPWSQPASERPNEQATRPPNDPRLEPPSDTKSPLLSTADLMRMRATPLPRLVRDQRVISAYECPAQSVRGRTRRPTPLTSEVRFDLASLAAVAGATLGQVGGQVEGDALSGISALSEALGVSRRRLRQSHAEGLSARLADRYAVRLGLHPSSVWPGWWAAVPGDADHLDDPPLEAVGVA